MKAVKSIENRIHVEFKSGFQILITQVIYIVVIHQFVGSEIGYSIGMVAAIFDIRVRMRMNSHIVGAHTSTNIYVSHNTLCNA